MAHELLTEIFESNSWRDGEFARMKANSHEVDMVFWCRMCIPLIYAHWEGFVVDSLKITLKYLNAQNLSPAKTKTHLIVLCLGDSYKSLSGKQSFQQRIDFTDKFNLLLSQTIKFKTKIETKSNLKSNVLEELCDIFQFKFSKFSEVVADIDRLIHIRNSIAHGENSIAPTMENIEKYIAAVQTAMEIFTEEIDDFLTNLKYLRGPRITGDSDLRLKKWATENAELPAFDPV